MNTPPFLLGAALLFWGWQTDFLAAGAVMAVVLEGARFVKLRWDFSNEDFARIWTVCAILFLAAVAYAFTSNNGPENIRALWENPAAGMREAGNLGTRTEADFLRWTPMIFFLFIAAQAFSERQEVPLTVISLIMRARWKKLVAAGGSPPAPRGVNVAYPYFVLCLMAASIHGIDKERHFFWGLAALLAWALWTRRPHRYTAVVWAAVLALALLLGYGGQRGIGALQRVVMNYNPDWFTGFSREIFDPTQSQTRLGQIGRMKGSGRITIRMEPKNGSRSPMYLREATYETYNSPTWFVGASKENFEQVAADKNGTSWPLLPGKTNNATNTISCYLDWWREGSPAGLLPLPTDAGRLENLHAYTLDKNGSGAVLAKGPSLVIFDACDGPGLTIDSPPQADDLAPPLSGETDALQQVIAEMHATGRNTDETLRIVNVFFQSKFTYSTWQSRPKKATKPSSPLSRFLLETRSGHCEYFATATVLILRQLHIPARYAVGYMVHEASGKGYVIRERDAHAWCLVWRNGTWENFDTTPASWVGEEAKHASPLEFLSDCWSRIQFEFSKFKVEWGENRVQEYLPLLAVPVVAVLLYRIAFRRKWRWRKRKPDERPAAGRLPGADSEFYELEQSLARRGLSRQPDEPLSVWLERAGWDPALTPLQSPLREVLRLHYQHRFDPKGLSGTDREALRDRAQSCLAALGRLPVEKAEG